MLWSAIEADLLAFGTKFESALGSDYHSLTHRSQRFADELFIHERPVNFRGVEKCDTKFDRLPNQRDHLLLIFRRTVAKTHSHAAEPNRRNFQATLSHFALFHRCSFQPLHTCHSERSEESQIISASGSRQQSHRCFASLTRTDTLRDAFRTYRVGHSDLRDAMSMEKRYCTSDLSSR